MGVIEMNLLYRKQKLQDLRVAIKKYEDEIFRALKKDLNKSAFEAYETEVGIVLEEINYTLKHLNKWAKPKRIKTPIFNFLSTSYIYHEPYGKVLIMSPWNYPFQLTITPLIGAFAAGNQIIVKPSEYSSSTAIVVEKLLNEVFSQEEVTVIRGGRAVNQALLEQKYDYIFFTGSFAVGKIVMESAAKYLTPVTLELGGKSPCIIDDSAKVKLAAKRIVWGKLLNAGQTCVAPDYILVHRNIKDELVKEMINYIKEFYGESPINNPDYPKIINEKHYKRILGLIENENIITGGQVDLDLMKIAPTILDDVSWQSPVMQEEIFGPVLQIIEFDNLDDVVTMIQNYPKPLALYFFTTNKENEKMLLSKVSFGGGCINDTIIHLSNSNLPFGGVGQSGMGQYHGKASFDTFSHSKSIIKKSNLVDINLRYPPFKDHLKLLKKILK